MVFSERLGKGDPLVLVHGWGMHGGMMRALAADLSRDYQVFLVDLPGHGRSAPLPSFGLDEVLASLKLSLPTSAHWVGWSLGGLLSIAMACQNPGCVKSLSLIASSPCFVECSNWPGVKADLLDQMGRDFAADYLATMTRFVSLQTFGQEGARQLSRDILALMSARPTPDVGSLLGALNLLRNLDLRTEFSELVQPVLSILGGRDRLVPAAQVIELQRVHPSGSVCLLDKAAHLPFLTHRQEVLEALREFLPTPSR